MTLEAQRDAALREKAAEMAVKHMDALLQRLARQPTAEGGLP